MKKSNLLFLILTLLLVLPAIFALFNKGFFVSDDGEWMIIRFSAFHQALRDGQFPVRFLSRLNYGYGYPVADFLYPGFMYVGEFFKFLGFGFVGTIKIILALSMMGSVAFTYLWLYRLFSKWSSFVGSLLYLYTPYHLFDLYKRGSVGEILALSIVPFILWQIERRSFFWASLGFAFLILSHNTLALLFLPFLIGYLISRGLGFTIYFLPSLMLGLGIAAFFWIPAIFDLQYTVFDKIQISDWQQYFAPLGLVGFVSFLIFAWTLIKLDLRNRTFLLMVFAGIVSLFFSLPISSMFGEWLPVSIIQFPFRFLSVTILTVSFLVAFLLDKVKGNNIFLLGGIFLAIGFASSFPYLAPQVFFDKGDSYYATNEDTTTVKKEYMPKWVRKIPEAMAKEKVEVLSGNGVVENLHNKGSIIKFDFVANQSSVVRVNTVYFPGWTIKIDGKKSLISYDNERGVMDINITKGKHSVLAKFIETPVRIFSDTVSLASILVVLLFVVRKKYEIFKK